jgi:dCMP deaminase
MLKSPEQLMVIAMEAAALSPDPSTQNGAVLATQDGRVVHCSIRCNEFPAGVHYRVERWERPAKYSYIEHAERNSIYACARYGVRTERLVMYCPWAACADCARGIIQARLSKLVTLAVTDGDTNDRWADTIGVAMKMLHEAGVEVEYMDYGQLEKFSTPTLRRDGSPWKVG